MPTLQWLGTLEPRPSPLVQALNALQPAATSLADWLRQQPERERRMLQATAEFMLSLPPDARERMLQQISPDRAAMLVEMSQRHGIGGFSLSPEGRLRIEVPLEVQEQQRQAEIRQIVDSLAPLRMASPERRAQLEQRPEVQQVLRRAAQVLPGIAAPDETGVYRVTEDFDQALDRLYRQAQTQEAAASAELKSAQAAAVPEELKLRARELSIQERDVENRYNIALQQREQNRDQFEKEFGLKREEFEQHKYEFAKNYALAEMEFEFNKQKWAQQLGLTEKELDLRRQEIENAYAIAMSQLEFDKQKWMDQLGLSEKEFEQRKREFAETLAFNRWKAEQELSQRAEELGIMREESKAQVAKAYAEVELIKAQAADIPLARALQQKMLEHQMSQDEAELLVRLYETESQERIAEADRRAQLAIAKMQNAVERERNRIIEENNLKDYDLGLLQTVAGIDDLALLSLIEKRTDLSEEEKQLIRKGIAQKRTREAWALAAEFVSNFANTVEGQSAIRQGRFDPFQAAATLTAVLSGELYDEDALVDLLAQQMPEQPSEGGLPPWAGALLTLAATGFIAKKGRDVILRRQGISAGTKSLLERIRSLRSGPTTALPPGQAGSGRVIPMGNAPGGVEVPPSPVEAAQAARYGPRVTPAPGGYQPELPFGEPPAPAPAGQAALPLGSMIYLPDPAELEAMSRGLPRPRPYLVDNFLNWLNQRLGGRLTGVMRFFGSPYTATPEEKAALSEILQRYGEQ